MRVGHPLSAPFQVVLRADTESARGIPRWPEGVVGSVTRCAGYHAAAVVPVASIVLLGVGGEWRVRQGLVVTAVALSASTSERAD
ncbi:hypothetical protein [Austwickia chelonae]|uniref:hypothetical protein n=1 Tax=Austwickia chelonae TaxID=100225 RepID=UPI003D31D77A